MAKNEARQAAQPVAQGKKDRWAVVAMAVMLAAAAVIYFYPDLKQQFGKPADNAPPLVTKPEPELYRMKVAQAVMVTVELDFGGRMPTIAQALEQVERVYLADDRAGRTFAILDAYGEPTADGKQLHMSMHVSSERPGLAWLKFRRTGETLWRARIGQPGDAPAGQKQLMIYVANGAGGNYVVDGSRGGASVLDAYLQNSQQRTRDVWPDGAEREVTFVYSACGCPVKVKAVREGDRTRRPGPEPVIFPDDPAAVSTIASLMKW